MKLDCISRAALAGRTARYASVATPFGPALLAVSGEAGGEALCWLNVMRHGDDGTGALARYWRNGSLVPHRLSLQDMADDVFAGRHSDLTILVAGSPFQHLVWRELARIAPGETVSYGELARRIGRPGASRAVGGAVGANPALCILPCHRVLGRTGRLHGFSSGLDLKEKFLRAEGWGSLAA